jgi:dihydropteroate synthase
MAVFEGRDLRRPQIMGIINATPDSFYSNSRNGSLELARKMVQNGADWIDIGGESTRPGSKSISIEEEISRVSQLVKDVSQFSKVSIDTRNHQVARIALDNGAIMVNDVSGLRDPNMVDLVIEKQCYVCIMHMKGEPGNMQDNPEYTDVCSDVFGYLIDKAKQLEDRGLPKEKIYLDPGIGFGKKLQHNLDLLKFSEKLRPYKILWGVSRKSMIGQICSQESTDGRLAGTLGVASKAFDKGIDIVRVHDVREHKDLFDVLERLVD